MLKNLRTGAAIFVCIYAATLAGLIGHPFIPASDLTRETLDFIKAASGMVSTLTSLVLGLLIVSAKGTFDTLDRDLRRFAASMSHLDLLLRYYGPEAAQTRTTLRELTEQVLADTWPDRKGRPVGIGGQRAADLIEQVPLQLFLLAPPDEARRYAQTRALSLVAELMEVRWLLIQETLNAIPTPFLVILVAWCRSYSPASASRRPSIPPC